MNNARRKFVRLKNLFTNEIVYTDPASLKRVEGDMTFILVFKETDPGRKYWVNEGAFTKSNI